MPNPLRSTRFSSPRAGWLLALWAGALLAPAGAAQARRSAEFAYPEARVWTSVVRLVRVDMSSPITEKDKDTGYLLFEYRSDGKAYAGSAEVIAVGEDGQSRVRVVFTVANMPSYVEQMMLDKLRRKLSKEFGPPREDRPPEVEPDREPDADQEPPPAGPEDAPTAAAAGTRS